MNGDDIVRDAPPADPLQDVSIARLALNQTQARMMAVESERDALRAQLAEAVGLLRRALDCDECQIVGVHRRVLSNFLSAFDAKGGTK